MIYEIEKAGIGKSFVSFPPQYEVLKPRFFRFVRVLSSMGGSNAPPPALSIPYLAVNAYGGQEGQARRGQYVAY